MANDTAGYLFGKPRSVKDMVLKVSQNGRYFTDQNGTPFFYLADTAWTLLKRMSREELEKYLENRAAKGFNVIQLYILRGLQVKNINGHLPLIDRDPAKPNEDFYRHVDYVFDRLNERGFVVGGVVTWGGHVSENYADERIFDKSNAYVHGKFLGSRYRDNCVIWYLGGDRRPTDNIEVWDAMAKGLKDGSGGRHLVSYHGPGMNGIPSSSNWFHSSEWLDFNVLQTGHGWTVDNYNFIAHDLGLRPQKPVLDMEASYENHPDVRNIANRRINAHHVRQTMYWQVLAGAAGHGYGCNDIWCLYDTDITKEWQDYSFPKELKQNTWWQTAMDFPGATCVGLARRLFELRPWYSMTQDQSVIAEGQGEGEGHIQAARATDGGFILVYLFKGNPVAIHMDKLTGHRVKAMWFNPRDGRFTEITGEFTNEGIGKFTPPTNYDEDDWVLVLEDEEKHYPVKGYSLKI